MANLDSLDDLFGKKKDKKDAKQNGKKHTIIAKSKAPLDVLKNAIVLFGTGIPIFLAITTFGPSVFLYNLLPSLIASAGLAGFQVWSSTQIRDGAKKMLNKLPIKDKLKASEEVLDAALITAQVGLFIASSVGAFATVGTALGPTMVPTIIFGATGIAAKLCQMIPFEKLKVNSK